MADIGADVYTHLEYNSHQKAKEVQMEEAWELSYVSKQTQFLVNALLKKNYNESKGQIESLAENYIWDESFLAFVKYKKNHLDLEWNPLDDLQQLQELENLLKEWDKEANEIYATRDFEISTETKINDYKLSDYSVDGIWVDGNFVKYKILIEWKKRQNKLINYRSNSEFIIEYKLSSNVMKITDLYWNNIVVELEWPKRETVVTWTVTGEKSFQIRKYLQWNKLKANFRISGQKVNLVLRFDEFRLEKNK